MSSGNGFAIEVGPPDTSGRRTVVATLGKLRHRDKFDVDDSFKRGKFRDAVIGKFQFDDSAHEALEEKIFAVCAAADNGDEEPEYRAISAAELATGDYRLTYSIDRVLVDSQPCLIGGPKKALKTSMAVDMALALRTCGLFLDKFQVLQPRNVLMCSAESGLATLQETELRICRAKGIDPPTDGLTFCERLPKMLNAIDMGAFARFVDDVAPDVVIFDPLYRMHSGDGAESIFKMGNPLAALGDLCLERGATPIICHHLKTSRLNQYAPAELDDLAYAGCAEYARQWLLLSRREAYEPGSGHHELWLTVGGSAGHNSLHALDVDEGSIDDVGGRHWSVNVTRADEARKNEQQRRVDAKAADEQRQLDADREAVCRVLAKHPVGLSMTQIGQRAAVSGRRWPKVFAYMLEADELVEVEVKVGNNKRSTPGYILNTQTT